MAFQACSAAWGHHQLLQTLKFSPPQANTGTQLIREGMKAPKGCIRIATLWANGNAYANRETLEQTLYEEGLEVGADFVVVTGSQILRGETIGSYGGGIMVADTIQRPILYGVACRASRVRLGLNLGQDWTIKYIYPNSLAERIGLKEGDRLLSVNGIYLPDDQFAFEREVMSKVPGDKVILEYLSRNGDKVKKEVMLEADQ
jgi:hypothetical protein